MQVPCLNVVEQERERNHVPNDVQVVLRLVRVVMLKWRISMMTLVVVVVVVVLQARVP